MHISPELSTGRGDYHHNNNVLIAQSTTVLFVRPGRIELPSTPWQGVVIPLNYGRFYIGDYSTFYKRIHFCAPGGIRTPNNCFEGRHDIHFTTGACSRLPNEQVPIGKAC